MLAAQSDEAGFDPGEGKRLSPILPKVDAEARGNRHYHRQ
jgi:hypothetical protein